MATQQVYNPLMAYPNLGGFENFASTMHNGDGPSLTSPHHPVTSIIGPPRINPQRLEEDSRYETRLQYPSAYINDSIYLGNIITGLNTVASQDQSFLRRILPPLLTDSMSVTWNRTHFAEGIAPVLPEEGVPPVLKFTQSSDFASVERRGIAIKCEANFAYTAKGRTLLFQQVAQITKACAESQDVDIIFTLMATDGIDYTDQVKRGRIEQDWQTMLDHKNAETFCLQKRHGNFDQDVFIKLIDSRKSLLSDRGANPNELIICRGAAMYLNGIGQDNSYAVAGPEGPERAKRNMFAPVNSYRGLSVNCTKQYILEKGKAPSDFLQGSRVGGEYYLMKAEHDFIEIYDFSKGRMQKVTKENARTSATGLVIKTRMEVEDEARYLEDEYGLNDKKTLYNIDTCDFLICRPFMQFLVGHAMMLEGGSRLGNSLIGTNSNFEWGDNVIDQTKAGTYNFYSKAVIFEKLFVTHIKDIVCKKYIGGGNTQFMTADELEGHAQNDWVPYSTKNDPSLFAIPIVPDDALPRHISLQGVFANDIDNGKKHCYRTVYGLKKHFNFGNPVSVHSLVNFYDPDVSHLNNSGLKAHLILSLGYHHIPLSNPGGEVVGFERVLGSSFLGNDIYPGCEQVLNGVVPTFKSMEYEKNLQVVTTAVR